MPNAKCQIPKYIKLGRPNQLLLLHVTMNLYQCIQTDRQQNHLGSLADYQTALRSVNASPRVRVWTQPCAGICQGDPRIIKWTSLLYHHDRHASLLSFPNSRCSYRRRGRSTPEGLGRSHPGRISVSALGTGQDVERSGRCCSATLSGARGKSHTGHQGRVPLNGQYQSTSRAGDAMALVGPDVAGCGGPATGVWENLIDQSNQLEGHDMNR